jgi:hypothetical protein
MMQRRKTSLTAILLRGIAFVFATVSLAGLSAAAPAGAFELVTRAEAELPPGSIPMLALRGSPTRRPNIIVISPAPNAGVVYSPVDLKLRFQAFGGAAIDRDSIVVTYIKQPTIDITQRLIPFITAEGITIAQAQVPPGKHQFWIELRDKDGRIGGAEVDFTIVK